MARESRQKQLLAGCLECLFECDELFVYVVLPLVCIAAVCLIGFVIYQTVAPHAFSLASNADCLSINPDNWLPPTRG